MNFVGLCNIITDAKIWVYNWDDITFAITIGLISLLMTASFIAFLKGLLGKEKTSFKIMPFLFFGILTAMLVLILMVRI